MSALARTLMIQGTASSVGKSLLVTALCRLFRDQGVNVAPFKAQNMALNAAVAVGGGEVGRAQAVQAQAARIPLTVDMNPVLLKPEGDGRSQVIVLGQPRGQLESRRWGSRKQELAPVIAGALERLRRQHQLVIIEGAGSPAEVNLQASDLVNMHVARLADAPVLLAADIDRGGVFASLVGTLDLLLPEDRPRVRGLLINKFRGDLGLFQPGVEFLQQRTGVPVLGVIPFVRDLGISDEDSVDLADARAATPGALEVAVVRLPHLSNQDDFDALAAHPEVDLRFIDRPIVDGRDLVSTADLVILPGSKTTVADLLWLRERGFEAPLRARAGRGQPLLGICGGCQMLGRSLHDPQGVESPAPLAALPGLDLLPFTTHFAPGKVTARVRARPATASLLGAEGDGRTLTGYEIHAGTIQALPGALPALHIVERNGQPAEIADGAVAGTVVGTLVHGLFDNAQVRAHLVRALRDRRHGPTAGGRAPEPIFDREAQLDRWAAAVGQALDWTAVRALAGA